jgi:hypothetical protein
MNARRLLTLVAALIVTATQAAIFAADTASSPPRAVPNVADTTLYHPLGGEV